MKYVQSSHSLLVWQVMEEQSQQPKLFVAAGQEAPKLAAAAAQVGQQGSDNISAALAGAEIGPG